MKGMMKRKLLKKLKSIRPVGYLKQDRVLQVKASDGYVESLTKFSTFGLPTLFVSRENEPKKVVQSSVKAQEEPEIIDVSELMRDLEDEETDLKDDNDNKENIGPSPVKSKHQLESNVFSENGIKADTESQQSRVLKASRTSSEPIAVSHRQTPLSEIDSSAFRRPELNSGSLFDPNLLVAFQQAVMEHVRVAEAERRARVEEANHGLEFDEQVHRSKSRSMEEDNPLLAFEEKCPPGGSDLVIFYTTTLRGIRKTFEDCNSVRFLLQSFRVLHFERDISMHKEFKEELWSTLDGKTVPPKLFVKGRYIGGAEEVLSLHEQGKLRQLFEGVPMDRSNGPCEACGGIRFVLCFDCNGSHKVTAENGQNNQCPNCNENGLILCPHCCS